MFSPQFRCGDLIVDEWAKESHGNEWRKSAYFSSVLFAQSPAYLVAPCTVLLFRFLKIPTPNLKILIDFKKEIRYDSVKSKSQAILKWFKSKCIKKLFLPHSFLNHSCAQNTVFCAQEKEHSALEFDRREKDRGTLLNPKNAVFLPYKHQRRSLGDLILQPNITDSIQNI